MVAAKGVKKKMIKNIHSLLLAFATFFSIYFLSLTKVFDLWVSEWLAISMPKSIEASTTLLPAAPAFLLTILKSIV